MGKRVPYLQRSLMILGEKRLALQIEIAHDHSWVSLFLGNQFHLFQHDVRLCMLHGKHTLHPSIVKVGHEAKNPDPDTACNK